MIKIENIDVYGWDAAVRGARNPMNSWDNSDSYWTHIENALTHNTARFEFFVGDSDLRLLRSLAKAGPDHGKFLRYLIVQLDITAPFYWWKEFKTYRKGRKFMDDGDEILDPEEFEMFIETNSCSTMHKIHEKPFTEDDFSREHLVADGEECLGILITYLNYCRECFLETKNKMWWWQLIQLLPSSYNQRRTVQLNYQVLKSMYHARKNHKLDEWREFCRFIETLPHSELITGDA